MNPKKQFFYLTELHDKLKDNSIKAICIEETNYREYDIKLVAFDLFGQLYVYKTFFIKHFKINEIVYDPIGLLKIIYEPKYNVKNTISVEMDSANHKSIAGYLKMLFVFIQDNYEAVMDYGFREDQRGSYILSLLNLKNFYEKVISLKTHKVSSSVNHVGKDNDFYETMVITYENEREYYFIKLVSDFLKSNYNPSKKNFSQTISRESAWSPSFDSYISEDNFTYIRAGLIEYITIHFDFTEASRFTLLNIPYTDYSMR